MSAPYYTLEVVKNRDIVRRGERVQIAAMTEDDQSQFQKWLADNKELREIIADPNAPSIEDQMKWFERSKQSDRKLFSIFTNEGELIGNGGFVDVDNKRREAQFRITIGNPDFWGKGYGTEATTLLLGHGHEDLGFQRIYLHVLPENERAIRTYEKVGFQKVKDYVAPSGSKKILMEIVYT